MINSIEPEEIKEVDWISLEEINEKNCHFIMYPAIENFRKGRHIA